MSVDPPLVPPGLAPTFRLLEVFEVAFTLRMSPEQVRRLLREKKLPARRFGRAWRVDPRELWAYIEAHRADRHGTERAAVQAFAPRVSA